MSEPKFKVGDMVILRDFRHEHRRTPPRDCNFHWVDSLNRFIGKEFEVEKVEFYRGKNPGYRLKKAGTWGYNEHWLEHAEIYPPVPKIEMEKDLFEI